MKLDFERLYIPYSQTSEPEFWKTHPKLSKYREFQDLSSRGLDKGNLIRLIILLYSKDSPLIRLYKDDLKIRKEEAAIYVGFDKDNTKQWSILTNDFFELRNDLVRDAIMRYLIMQNNNIWTIICAKEQTFYELISTALKPIDQNEKDKDVLDSSMKKDRLTEVMAKLNTDLESFYEILFANNPDIKRVYNENDTMKLTFTNPESVAKMLINASKGIYNQ